MIVFYKKHLEFITEHAVAPDKRRYSLDQEACRHYIDMDHYLEIDSQQIPKYWDKAVEKYSIDTLNAHGIVPWHIDVMTKRLTKAFMNEDPEDILKISSELGHYVADAHVPLHTTKNYNGQLTNQKGIHGLWESRIPELFSDHYSNLVGRANYVNDPLEAAWHAVNASFNAKDSVLEFESKLNSMFELDKKYAFEQRNNMLIKVYSKEFTSTYNQMLAGMVERRYQNAIYLVGSLWFTAWVNAGQPNLSRLVNYEHKALKNEHSEDSEHQKNDKKNILGHED